MDVQCERCKTEYEFDDALVSGRGTTVRCTHCGHQFKVRRADVGDAAADRWVVQTAGGSQLTFLTLRELQRAILAKQVARSDILLLGGAAPRPLGSITELEPFFEGRASSRPPPGGNAGASVAAEAPARRTQSFGTAPQQPPAVAPQPAPPFFEAPRPAYGTLTTPSPGAAQEVSSPLPPPTVPVRRSMPTGDDELQDMQAAIPPSSDDGFDFPRRRRVGGWIVAFVLLLAVGVVSWVVAKPYVMARSADGGPRLDPRAQGFLADGEKALADGDLEGAQQDFDKASGLAERDPRVLLDEARVAAASADVMWLKLRLLPAEAAEEARTTKAQLDDRVVRARRAADEAVAAAPEDRAAVRTKVDALRLQGDRDGARSLVSKVAGVASQPETAYVLAALDLAEPQPFWTPVIDRLRLAVAGEGSAGRARAALVYALAKSGDAPGAVAELAKLDALPRPYPCLPNLHTFVDKTPAKASADRAVPTNVPHIDVSALPTAGPPQGAAASAGPVDGTSGDQSMGMHAASAAIKKGEWDRARRIYEALVSRNPGDSEALAGIGDVERAQGNSANAIAAYKRALAVNPSYLPALLGVADTEWASGDRASARRSYKEIGDHFPEGTYPSYVRARSEAPAPAPAAPSASSSSKPWDPGDGI
jgi:predicted Zn finger-like uncharacterized protein